MGLVDYTYDGGRPSKPERGNGLGQVGRVVSFCAVKSCSGSSATEEIIRAVDERGHRCRGLRWLKKMLTLNVAVTVDNAGDWQAGRYQRGKTGQRPGCTGNPFRPR